MPGSIFISYSKHDNAFVRYLHALLTAEGFSVWFDDELDPGEEWWDRIERQVIGCGAFIVVMSGEARQSKWVQRELLLAESHQRPIFPILLAGDVWSHLADVQFADMREGVRAPFPAKLRQRLNAVFGGNPALPRQIEITVEEGDILTYPADVAVFKFARSFHGADSLAASRLETAQVNSDLLRPAVGAYSYQATQGALAAPYALFIGTKHLRSVNYTTIQELGAQSLQFLNQAAPETRHFAMTIHGANMGLDEREALISQVNGYLEAFESGDYPPQLTRISIIERTHRRIAPMLEALQAYLADVPHAEPIENGYRLHLPDPAAVAASSLRPKYTAPNNKTHVYVTLSANNADSEDIFYYGIQSAVHANGLLCERLDPPAFSDDIISQIRQRIDTALLVVADISVPDAAIYWQVGYAWGKRKPLVLLANHAATPLFEGVDCVEYAKIRDIETALKKQLQKLKSSKRL